MSASSWDLKQYLKNLVRFCKCLLLSINTSVTYLSSFCSLKPLEEDVTDLQSHVLGSVFLQCSSIFFHIGKEIVVYVRGEGLNDKGKTGKRGRAVIKVNGKDYSPHRTGFNIVVLNAVTGILFFFMFLQRRNYISVQRLRVNV